MTSFVHTTQLAKHYRFHGQVLTDIRLNLSQDSRYVLLGPNGSGKTTLLKILSGLLQPSKGSIYYKGQDVSHNRKPLQKDLGFMPQQSASSTLRARDFLRYLARMQGLPNSQAHEDIHQLARSLNAEGLLDSRLKNLSGGQKKLISLLQAFMGKPELIVLDEPFRGLDANNIRSLHRLIQQYKATYLISSQARPEVEEIATHIGFLRAGQLVTQDSYERLCCRGSYIRIVCHAPSQQFCTKLRKLGTLQQKRLPSGNHELVIEAGKEIQTKVLEIMGSEKPDIRYIQNYKDIMELYHDLCTTISEGE